MNRGRPVTTAAWIRKRAETIVRNGEQTHERIAMTTAWGLHAAVAEGEDVGGVVTAVIAGACASFDLALPHERAAVLQQVVDAVGEGVTAFAVAAQSALRPPTPATTLRARGGAARLTRCLAHTRRRLVPSVANGLARLGHDTVTLHGSITDHARKMLSRIDAALAIASAAGAGSRSRPAAVTAATTGCTAGDVFPALGARLASLDQGIALPEPRLRDAVRTPAARRAPLRLVATGAAPSALSP